MIKVKKLLLYYILMLFFITISYSQVSQTWVKEYSSSNSQGYGNDIAIDGEGNIYVTGYDFNTIKYNSAGTQLWVRQYYGVAKSMIIDPQGNLYITGNDDNSTMITIKYSPSGEQLWLRTYTDPQNRYLELSKAEIALDNSGGLFIAANVYLDSTVSTIGVLTLKYNTGGTLLWAKNYNHPSGFQWAESNSITTDNLGNSYVTGFTYTGSEDYDLLLIKYSPSGNEEWVRTENGPAGQNDLGQRVKIAQNGDIYVGGAMAYMNGAFVQFDVVLLRYNSSGTKLWTSSYDEQGFSDVPFDMTLDNEGNVIMTGYAGSLSTFLDILTVKFSQDGVFRWAKSYNGSSDNWDEGKSVTTDAMGNVYITGTAWENTTDLDYTTIKYSPTGEQVWMMQYDGGYIDAARSIAVDNNGYVYITGYHSTRNATSSATTIKYSQPVGIEPISNETPSEFSLLQNYPNPFNPVTNIEFSLPVRSLVKLVVYDILGKEVKQILNRELNAGKYKTDFDAANLPGGIYFYQITANGFSETRKMVLVK